MSTAHPSEWVGLTYHCVRRGRISVWLVIGMWLLLGCEYKTTTIKGKIL